VSRRTNSWNAYRSVLTSGITNSATDIPVEAIEDELAYPAYLVMDPDSPTKREYIKVIGKNGLSFDTGTTGNRGLDGSVGGDAQAHDPGATMRAVSVKQWLDDIFDDIEDLEADGLTYLLIDGSRAMAGALNMGGSNQINLLANGTSDQDAATVKQFTDGDDTLRSETEAADLLLLDLAGVRDMTGALKLVDGIAAAPALAFATLPDTGMYLFGTSPGRIGWAADGTVLMTLFDEALSLSGGVEIKMNLNDDITWGGELNRIRFDVSNAFSIVADSTSRFAVTGTGWFIRDQTGANAMSGTEVQITVGVPFKQTLPGSQAAPAYSFAGFASGLYNSGTGDVMGLSVKGTATLILSETWMRSAPTYNLTTGNATNLNVAAGTGQFARSTASSRRYKRNIEDLDPGAGVLTPHKFNYNVGYVSDDPEGIREHWYFIAEEVHEAFGDQAVIFDDKGNVEDVDVRAIVAILAAKVNALENA
jgi:hypothetical protein